MSDSRPQRLIIGICGASGAIYGVRLLELLRDTPIETHLVVSKSVMITLAHETDISWTQLKAMADVSYSSQDIGAAIASGSFKTMGMIIAPCSIRILSEIASGVTSSLLTRAADVVLKERRRLVLMVRETAFDKGNLIKTIICSVHPAGVFLHLKWLCSHQEHRSAYGGGRENGRPVH